MKQRIVVLFANPYRVERDDGRGQAEGVSVSYLYGDSLEPVLNGNGSMGQRPAKASLPLNAWERFASVPGMYEGEFTMTIGSDGKPTLRLLDVKFVSMVTLVERPADKKS